MHKRILIRTCYDIGVGCPLIIIREACENLNCIALTDSRISCSIERQCIKVDNRTRRIQVFFRKERLDGVIL